MSRRESDADDEMSDVENSKKALSFASSSHGSDEAGEEVVQPHQVPHHHNHQQQQQQGPAQMEVDEGAAASGPTDAPQGSPVTPIEQKYSAFGAGQRVHQGSASNPEEPTCSHCQVDHVFGSCVDCGVSFCAMCSARKPGLHGRTPLRLVRTAGGAFKAPILICRGCYNSRVLVGTAGHLEVQPNGKPFSGDGLLYEVFKSVDDIDIAMMDTSLTITKAVVTGYAGVLRAAKWLIKYEDADRGLYGTRVAEHVKYTAYLVMHPLLLKLADTQIVQYPPAPGLLDRLKAHLQRLRVPVGSPGATALDLTGGGAAAAGHPAGAASTAAAAAAAAMAGAAPGAAGAAPAAGGAGVGPTNIAQAMPGAQPAAQAAAAAAAGAAIPDIPAPAPGVEDKRPGLNPAVLGIACRVCEHGPMILIARRPLPRKLKFRCRNYKYDHRAHKQVGGCKCHNLPAQHTLAAYRQRLQELGLQ